MPDKKTPEKETPKIIIGFEDPVEMEKKLKAKREKKKAENAPHPEVFCGFCLKSSREVRQIIAGYAVYICDECIVEAHKILKDEGVID